ncbi:hypothetical protein [Nocardia brasiliensis]|uniref:hypothetical protein n=1 Tax=Nocardia brasiliensis TaxID=37326 RepID=UPI003D93E3C7
MTDQIPPPDAWYCEAYGPELAEIATCFFAEARGHACTDAEECGRLMAAQRQQLLARINEMAAHGDETGAYLASQFTHPEQLLGGRLAPADDENEDEGR